MHTHDFLWNLQNSPFARPFGQQNTPVQGIEINNILKIEFRRAVDKYDVGILWAMQTEEPICQ